MQIANWGLWEWPKMLKAKVGGEFLTAEDAECAECGQGGDFLQERTKLTKGKMAAKEHERVFNRGWSQ